MPSKSFTWFLGGLKVTLMMRPLGGLKLMKMGLPLEASLKGTSAKEANLNQVQTQRCKRGVLSMGATSSHRYRSQFERKLATLLELSGIPFSYEPMHLSYTRKSAYTPDFLLTANGFFIEAKGYFSPQDRGKHLLVKQQHPNTKIRFVFQNAHQALSKKSSTTYATWCEKHGFLWAHRIIPKDWLGTSAKEVKHVDLCCS